jgi:D-alanyl-D-alanine carboxypeptidase (penicillin-binding protein 5/6)
MNRRHRPSFSVRRDPMRLVGAVAVVLIAVTALHGGGGAAVATSGISTATASATGDASERYVVNRTRFRADGAVTAPPRVKMRAWAIADLDTGTILGVHAYQRHLPEASTLKLLTAVTATTFPARPHRVTYAEAHPAYCTCAGLRAGRRYGRHSLLTGMLLPSGNDAAEAIAGSDPHGRAGFLAAMNAEARKLGATETHAVNPSGLTARGAYSSARDLLVFLRAAQSNRVVERFLTMRSGRVGPIGGRSHRVYRGTDYVNTYPRAEGKSGYTTPALNTLVVASPMETPVGMHRIGVATLGAPGGYSTTGTRALTRWAATNYAHLTGVGVLPAAPGPVVGAQVPYVNNGTDD